MDNANSPEYLEKIKQQVFENLRHTAATPSVQMTSVPRTPLFPADNENDPDDEGDAEDLDEREGRLDDEDDDKNPDTRYTERKWDQRIEHDGELSDSEDETENAKNGVKRQPGQPRRRPGIMDHKNPYADTGDIDSGTQTPASANGDEMLVDPAQPPIQALNMQVSETIMAAKASETPQPPQPARGEEVASNGTARSAASAPKPNADPEDVEMGEGEASATATTAGPVATPPESPPAAPAETAVTSAEDVEMSEAKEEGRAEREKEDVAAETAREGDAAQGTI